jgi:hypothetical protein
MMRLKKLQNLMIGMFGVFGGLCGVFVRKGKRGGNERA